uniref:Uncharacterized protein n=1 Tax=Oryza glumipatula TaxID=40148 RepID=A0A0D9Z106_9ORYZ
MIKSNGINDVCISVNSSKVIGCNATFSSGLPIVSTGVLCAKASMLLQSQWADSNLDAFFASAMKPNFFNLPMSRLGGFSGQVILPLAHTFEPEEFLEVIKLGNTRNYQDTLVHRDLFLLQDTSSPNCILDLTSMLEPATPRSRISGVNGGGCAAAASSKAVMTIAFQFVFESHLQDSVAAMAWHIISSVQRIAVALSSSLLVPPGVAAAAQLAPATLEAAALPRWICQSYRFHFGAVWRHPSAILYSSLKVMPVFTFANRRRRRQAQGGGGGYSEMRNVSTDYGSLSIFVFPRIDLYSIEYGLLYELEAICTILNSGRRHGGGRLRLPVPRRGGALHVLLATRLPPSPCAPPPRRVASLGTVATRRIFRAEAMKTQREKEQTEVAVEESFSFRETAPPDEPLVTAEESWVVKPEQSVNFFLMESVITILDGYTVTATTLDFSYWRLARRLSLCFTCMKPLAGGGELIIMSMLHELSFII